MAAGLLLLVCTQPAMARADGARGVIPPGREQAIQELARPFVLGAEVTPGWRLDGLSIGESSFAFVLGHAGEQVKWNVGQGEETVTPATPGPAARAALDALQKAVRPRLTLEFWKGLLVVHEPPPQAPVHRTDRSFSSNRTFDPWPWVAALVALLGLVALERAGPSFRRAVAAVVLVAGAAAVALASWKRAVGGSSEEWRLADAEHAGVQLLLAVAAGALLLAVGRAVRRLAGHREAAIDAGLVLVWSLFVRVVLTTPNILTDGGSGWSRLLGYVRGFGTLSVSVDALMPDRTLTESIWVPRLLAALLPPLVVLFGRRLGFSRLVAFLSGLAIASLPLHAALFTSDFEVGALVSLLVLGLLLVAAGTESPTYFGAGAAVLAFAIWGRPESVVVGLPFLVLAARFDRAFWLRPAAAGGVVWLGLSALVRLAGLRDTMIPHPLGQTTEFISAVHNLPMLEFFTTSAVLPVWFWLPVPLGLLLVRGLSRWVVLAGILAGYVPLVAMPATGDATKTFVEVFRYSSVMLPFVALLSGAGLAAVCAWVAGRIPRRGAGVVLPGLVVAAMIATPLVNRSYLAREYGPSLEVRVFREALAHVPAGCHLVVPDDDGFGSRMLEVRGRYNAILHEADPEGLARGTAPRIVAVSSFLERATGDRLPTIAEMVPEDRAAGDGSCWLYFSGTYCNDGYDGTKPPHCAEFETRFKGAPLWTTTAEYRSHRLVTRPARTDAPFYVPKLEFGLFRVGR